MSSFQDLDETLSQEPWGRTPKEFRAVSVELQDRESLFYADCAKFLRVIVNVFHPNVKRQHPGSYLLY